MMIIDEKRNCLRPYLGLDIDVRGVVASIRGFYKKDKNQATLLTITDVKSRRSSSINIHHLNFIIYNNDFQQKYNGIKLGDVIEVKGKVIQYPYRDSFGVKYRDMRVVC